MYLMLPYMKEKAAYNWNLSDLIAFIRINLFVKMDLNLWLNKPFCLQNEELRKNEHITVSSYSRLVLINVKSNPKLIIYTYIFKGYFIKNINHVISGNNFSVGYEVQLI